MAKLKTQLFKAMLTPSTNKLWAAHFIVPAEIAVSYVKDSSRRAVCSINSSPSFQCGILNGPKGKFVITVNAKIRKQLGLEFGDVLHVELQEDDSEYGLPIPEEMKVAMEMDDDASRYFHELSPGKQRTLLYIAANVKNPDARALRAIAILEHLKEHSGKIDYKQLDESIKAKRSGRKT